MADGDGVPLSGALRNQSVLIGPQREENMVDCLDPLNSAYFDTDNTSCPRIWDGYLCWPAVESSQSVMQVCPKTPQDNGTKYAFRYCGANATWVTLNGEFAPTKTDFTACDWVAMNWDPDEELFHLLRMHLPVIKQMSLAGYTTSLLLLVLAFSLLGSLKRLRCARIKIHLHLFASFIVRAIVLIHKHNTSSDRKLDFECWVMMLIFHYSLMANYCWILMEGLYLHNLIFMSVYADHNNHITKYVVMGWGLPAPCVIIWAGVRFVVGGNSCWASDVKWIEWFLRGPITISIVLNFIFFINIARVVFIKMSSSYEPEARRLRYKKWFKSTLVLVPLFGAHHTILMVMSIAAATPLFELYWLYIDQLFTSFQGSVVALLYCFLNGEVQTEAYRLLPECVKLKILSLRGRSRETTQLTLNRKPRSPQEKCDPALGLLKQGQDIPMEIRIMGEDGEVEARL